MKKVLYLARSQPWRKVFIIRKYADGSTSETDVINGIAGTVADPATDEATRKPLWNAKTKSTSIQEVINNRSNFTLTHRGGEGKQLLCGQ